MKKAAAVFLVMLALTHLAGVMPFSLYFMQEVKTEAKVKLCSGQHLTEVVVQSNEYNDARIFQFTGDDEFTYRGQMYDFKSVSKVGNEYIFYALEDNQETSLVGFLKNVFEQQNDRCNNAKSPFSGLFKTFEKDFIHHLPQQLPATLTTKCFPIDQFVSKLQNGHRTVIFHPPV